MESAKGERFPALICRRLGPVPFVGLIWLAQPGTSASQRAGRTGDSRSEKYAGTVWMLRRGGDTLNNHEASWCSNADWLTSTLLVVEWAKAAQRTLVGMQRSRF